MYIPYPSPYPIEKVGDSPYPYPYPVPVNAGIPVKTKTGSDNIYGSGFIFHLNFQILLKNISISLKRKR